eukprot:m.160294 g.160294  ORF g.160294 m.160294 type:complete len:663 (-) comp13383_c3_seq3:3357-5345(-)
MSDVGGSGTSLLKKALLNISLGDLQQDDIDDDDDDGVSMPLQLFTVFASKVLYWNERQKSICVFNKMRQEDGVKELHVDGMSLLQPVRQIHVNCNGTKVLLLHNSYACFVDVSERDRASQKREAVVVDRLRLSVGIVQAMFHPLSPSSLFVLKYNGEIDSYNLDKDYSAPSNTFNLKIANHSFGLGTQFCSFGFGLSGWERFTMYVVRSSTDILTVSPVIPIGCLFSDEFLLELKLTSSTAEETLKELSYNQETGTTQLPRSTDYIPLKQRNHPHDFDDDDNDNVSLVVANAGAYPILFTLVGEFVYVQMLVVEPEFKEMISCTIQKLDLSPHVVHSAEYVPMLKVLVIRHSGGVASCFLDVLSKIEKEESIDFSFSETVFTSKIANDRQRILGCGVLAEFSSVLKHPRVNCVVVFENNRVVIESVANKQHPFYDNSTRTIQKVTVGKYQKEFSKHLREAQQQKPNIQLPTSGEPTDEMIKKARDDLFQFEETCVMPLKVAEKVVKKLQGLNKVTRNNLQMGLMELSQHRKQVEGLSDDLKTQVESVYERVGSLVDRLEVHLSDRYTDLSSEEESVRQETAKMKVGVTDFKRVFKTDVEPTLRRQQGVRTDAATLAQWDGHLHNQRRRLNELEKLQEKANMDDIISKLHSHNLNTTTSTTFH